MATGPCCDAIVAAAPRRDALTRPNQRGGRRPPNGSPRPTSPGGVQRDRRPNFLLHPCHNARTELLRDSRCAPGPRFFHQFPAESTGEPRIRPLTPAFPWADARPAPPSARLPARTRCPVCCSPSQRERDWCIWLGAPTYPPVLNPQRQHPSMARLSQPRPPACELKTQ